ncbi:MAG: MBL fold metallo-hydrolase [Oscillospiraceae bacterium]|nr:MBL fold metallo-hydrolase [Oscillospiraceae bacterium]
MMKIINSAEVLPNIFAVSNRQVNFYLVKVNRKYIAFDAGGSKKMSLKELGKLNIKPEDITDVFLTHTDSDHTAAIGLFSRAKIYISKPEKQIIDGRVKRAFFMDNKLDCPHETLDDGETVDTDGAGIKCMVTPGHTPGSACYIMDGKYLFSGDNFGLKNGKATLFIPLFNMDGSEQKKSIAKISGLQNIEAVFTGHHGYSANFAGAFEDWRGDSKLNVT